MSIIKKDLFLTTAISGLKSANKHNPFWSKSDAMALINVTRKNATK